MGTARTLLSDDVRLEVEVLEFRVLTQSSGERDRACIRNRVACQVEARQLFVVLEELGDDDGLDVSVVLTVPLELCASTVGQRR